MLEKIKSRKFVLAVVSALIIILNDGLGLKIPQESVMSFSAVIASYIFGQAYIDSKK